MVKNMVKENIIGQTRTSLKVNGKMMLLMERVKPYMQTKIHIKEILRMVKRRVMGNINGTTGISIKDHFKTIENTDKESTYHRMETDI